MRNALNRLPLPASHSDIVAEWVEEHFSDLMVDILSQEHQSNDLQRCESLEFCPLNVEVEQVGSLLLFFCVCANLLNCSINQVLGVPVDRAEIPASHHLVVAGDASIAFLLIFQELFPQELEEIGVRRGALSR